MKKKNRIVKKSVLSSNKGKSLLGQTLQERIVHLIRTNKRLKQMMIALGSSLVIGITFGLIFLTMVKQEEPQFADTLHSSIIAEDSEQHNNEMDQPETQIEANIFYVVQAGLFSDKENAEKYGEQFSNFALPGFIWERDNQYYVFIGLGSTEEKVKSIVDEMDKHHVDVYVKEWKVDAKTGDRSKQDFHFLQLFNTFWNGAINGEFEKTNWVELVNLTDVSEEISQFQETIEEIIQKNDYQDYVLLKLMYDYENIP